MNTSLEFCVKLEESNMGKLTGGSFLGFNPCPSLGVASLMPFQHFINSLFLVCKIGSLISLEHSIVLTITWNNVGERHLISEQKSPIEAVETEITKSMFKARTKPLPEVLNFSFSLPSYDIFPDNPCSQRILCLYKMAYIQSFLWAALDHSQGSLLLNLCAW